MDCRLTLNNSESFLTMLQDAYQAQEKISLLFDENGINRAEVLIEEIHYDTANATIELRSGFRIALKNIIALNGIFLPEYGEC